MKVRLNRRTFLRGVLGGATVSVALPPLEAMFNAHGDALAQGQPIPKRFGLWFFGNGIRRAHWIPDGTGLGWQARAELEPLARNAALKSYVSPVTGFEIKTATHAHHSGMTGMLTGARYYQNGTTRDTIVSTFAYPSIDQVIAQRWFDDPATRTPYKSLEVGICRFRGTDEGTTFQHLSHNGPDNVNPSEYEPINVFRRLFGAPLDAQKNAARATILDAVRGDVLRLKPRVSAQDKTRLDQHLESIRTIEQRIATSAARCTRPNQPAEAYPDDQGREPITEKNQIMSDLIAMALACDLTRVFSVLYSTAGAGTVFWQVGARNGQHQIAHDERDPGAELQPTIHASVVFTMEQLAYFLERLRTTQEGAGNLLDSAAILINSELSEGYTHSNDEFPILIAGKAGGALRGGLHYRSTTRENTSKVLLTLLRATGDPRPSFGYGPGETNQVISDLLV
jgi:hypothetical protein